MAWEKELVGIYITTHPLATLNDLLKDEVKHTVAEILEEQPDKQKVVVGGTIKEARRITTKKGDTMCIVQLEDITGTIGVTVFPRLYEETAELWVEDTVVIVMVRCRYAMTMKSSVTKSSLSRPLKKE